jgi:hypothetical protein
VEIPSLVFFSTNVTALFAFITNISIFQIIFSYHNNYRLMALFTNTIRKITIVHEFIFHSLNITKTYLVFFYIFFLIPTITTAGTPRYIPMFNMITDNPIPKTSDSEFAFSISDSDEIIGVIAIFTASLNNGFSRS